MMITRNGTIDDALQLAPLLDQLGYTMTMEQLHHKIDTYNNKDGHAILIAEEDSIIFGFITMACYECFVLPGGCMHIESIIVDINQRGKGIGKKLVAAAQEYALNHNCTIMELITYNHRRKDGTHAFYESLGFKDHHLTDITYFLKEIG